MYSLYMFWGRSPKTVPSFAQLALPNFAQLGPSLPNLAHLCPTRSNFAHLCPTRLSFAQLCSSLLNFAHLCPTRPNSVQLGSTLSNSAQLCSTHSAQLSPAHFAQLWSNSLCPPLPNFAHLCPSVPNFAAQKLCRNEVVRTAYILTYIKYTVHTIYLVCM